MRAVSLLLAALLVCALAPANAQVPSDMQAALDARTSSVPGTGIVVGIIDHGKQSIYVSGSSGNGRPLDEHTLFEIGSDTKTFTATALASMVLDGQVRLSDPLAKYLPPDVRVPSKNGQTITLLDLAEQRSGLPRLPGNMDEGSLDDPYASYSIPEMYAFLSQYTLTRLPGAAFEYSNYGISVLGQALAYHAGTTYPKLIRARVLDPLGMTETTFATMPAWDFPPFGAGHDLGGAPVPAWHFDSMLPAGGIRSSLTDMLKYLRCNLGEGPLAKECLFAQQSRADGAPGHGIGLVWWTNTANGAISHGGDTKGFHAQIAISKDHQTGVVVMSNGPVVTDIAAHVLLPSYPIAVCHAVPAAADASPYAGTYCNASGGFLFQVASGKNAGELSIAVLPQDALTYTLVKPETYAAASVGAAVTFVKENGAVVGMRFAQNGEDFPVLRLDAQGKALVTALPSQFPPVVSLDAATLEQYVGAYNAKDLTFTVTLNDDQLYVRLTGQSAIPVYPSAKDEFFCKVVDAQVSFARDASGNVTALTLHQNGHDLAAPRTKAAPI